MTATMTTALDRDERIAAAKRAGVSDAVVSKALAAYEDMPTRTGREDRMRMAIAAVVRMNGARLDRE